MQIEFFPDGHPECPLILIYGSDPKLIRSLREKVLALANDLDTRVEVNKLDGFQTVGNCQLTLTLGTKDLGIQIENSLGAFVCILRNSTWEQIAGLLDPFCSEFKNIGTHFQFLDTTSKISLLISTTKSW
jgi:hypothetical protein